MCTNTTVNIFDGTIATWLDPFRKEILNADARIPMLDFCRSPGSTLNSMTKEPKNILIYLTWATPLQCILDIAFNLDIYTEEQDCFKLSFVCAILEKKMMWYISDHSPLVNMHPQKSRSQSEMVLKAWNMDTHSPTTSTLSFTLEMQTCKINLIDWVRLHELDATFTMHMRHCILILSICSFFI